MKRFITVLCLLLSCLLLFSSCAGGKKGDSIAFSLSVQPAGNPAPEMHVCVRDRMTTVAGSEAARLLLDAETLDIAYEDDFSDLRWTLLPQRANTLASAVSLVLISSEGRFYLNSQDHSVAFGTAKAETLSDGVRLTYIMAPDFATAHKPETALSPGDLLVRLSLLIAVDDGKLSVELDCGDLFVSEGYVLEKLSVFPYFGVIGYDGARQAAAPAAEDPEPSDEELGADDVVEVDAPDMTEKNGEDYLVVPDGCGALIYTDRNGTEGLNLSFGVHTGDGVNSPYVPAAVFGVKKGNAAFVCAVTQGDAVASVRVLNLANEGSVFNAVYPEFLITETAVVGTRVYYGARFTEKIRLVYKFLSGSAADYISMAIAAGEELTRAGILPGTQISDNVVPLNVGVICSADGAKATAASDYLRTEDLLGVLKAKGVNRANLLLQGAMSGGLAQNAPSAMRPLSFLGGSDDLERLCDFAAKQSFDLYVGVNMVTAEKKDAAFGIDGTRLAASVKNPLFPEYGNRNFARYLLRADRIERGVLRLLYAAEKYNVPGICVNDAARHSYEDVAAGMNRAQVDRKIADELAAIAAGRKLAMNGADLGAVKNASLITSLPFDAYFETEEGEHYEAVPFFPAMLHGSVIYSGFPANEQPSPYLYLLKTVEYGGAPYYEWTASQNSRLYYENGLTEATEFLAGMNASLGDLLSEPISGHLKLRDGVFRTVYENGAVVIVNYNHYSVNVNSISVAPYSYLRLN